MTLSSGFRGPLCWESVSPLYRLSRRVLGAFFGLYWPVRVRAAERIPGQGSVILAGNHPTVLDGLLVALAVPRRVNFLVRADVMNLPLLGHFLRAMGYISVSSGNRCLESAQERLAEGRCVAIFPESDPTHSLVLREFRRGVAVMARGADVPVVPFAVVGTEKIVQPHSRYLPCGSVELRFGEALQCASAESVEQFRDRIQAAVAALLLAPREDVRPRAAWLLGLCLVPASAFIIALAALFRRPEREIPTVR